MFVFFKVNFLMLKQVIGYDASTRRSELAGYNNVIWLQCSFVVLFSDAIYNFFSKFCLIAYWLVFVSLTETA